ncbi:MAG TPA: sigma 54-interacting transcriptional regulator [Pyrinomonadaceae bacterium]|jgi:two-component system response regulator AtoC
MDPASHLLRRIDDPNLSVIERAQLRCEVARDLEEAGDYEAARNAMGELWRQVGERPKIEGLDRHTAAEVILCAGSLSGWIGGGAAQAEEIAKDLISESIAIFEDLREVKKVAEARIELALCYWREGSFDDAREMLGKALKKLGEEDADLRAVALLRSAVVELSAGQFQDVLRILTGSASLFEASRSHALRGKFHLTLAGGLRALAASEHREEYIDRALVEYTAASFHLERAGHTSDWASVETSLGVLCFTLGRHAQAHDHLSRARRLLDRLKDSLRVAQVDETRARVLLAEGRSSEAEKVARLSVQALEKMDAPTPLSQARITHGVALARLGFQQRARRTLQRVLDEAAEVGRGEDAGRAGLAILEELGACLTADEMRAIYERTDQLLSDFQDTGTLTRLRTAARQVLGAERAGARAFALPTFIYATEQMAGLLREAHRVAPTDHTVLISGETGTGKELLGHMIHEWSGRAGEFVVVSCAALTDGLIDSELFGHRRRSFSAADEDLPGVVEQAEGGTLFLDGIADLSLNGQGKLLRVIEHGEIHRIGAPRPERLDVRIIAATNRKLKEEVERGRFREELFYRLQTFNIEIPPLRERVEDIRVISEHLIKEVNERYGTRVAFTPEAMEAIKHLPLKGNVLELRSLIERTMLTVDASATVGAESIARVALRQSAGAGEANRREGYSLETEVRRYEGALIKHALEAEKGSITRAARLLGVTHQGLAFILHGRQKDLAEARTPVKRRRRSILGTARRKRQK